MMHSQKPAKAYAPTEPPRRKAADPFPQALDGRPDAAACYPQVAADSKPRLAEMHGVLQAPPPMLSSGPQF